jgi:hypothetical protein
MRFAGYGCRPWLIHPYTGKQLHPRDLIAVVGSDNPELATILQGQSLDQLLEPRDDLGGEPVLVVEDKGLVVEDNPTTAQSWQDDQSAELANAEALGIPPSFRPDADDSVVHAPYYGLYCLEVRLCVPYVSATPGQAWRYWIRPRFQVHQPACWGTWWWHRHFDVEGELEILPWYPLCVPWGVCQPRLDSHDDKRESLP